jgi:hypothetical protein
MTNAYQLGVYVRDYHYVPRTTEHPLKKERDRAERKALPKRKLHSLKMRAVDKSTRVPGESLWPIVVGVEFIDGEAVVAGRCKSQHQHRTQQDGCSDDLGIDGMAQFRPLLETTAKYRQSSSPSGRVFRH